MTDDYSDASSVKSINDSSLTNSSAKSESKPHPAKLNNRLGQDFIQEAPSPLFQSKTTLANGHPRSSGEHSRDSSHLLRKLSLRYTDSQDKANCSPARRQTTEFRLSGRTNRGRCPRTEEGMGSLGERSSILGTSLKTSKSFEKFKINQVIRDKEIEKRRHEANRNYNPKGKYYRIEDFKYLDDEIIEIYRQDKRKGKRGKPIETADKKRRRDLSGKKNKRPSQPKLRKSLQSPNLGNLISKMQIPRHNPKSQMRAHASIKTPKPAKPRVEDAGQRHYYSLNAGKRGKQGDMMGTGVSEGLRGRNLRNKRGESGPEDSSTRLRISPIWVEGADNRYMTPAKKGLKNSQIEGNSGEAMIEPNMMLLGQSENWQRNFDLLRSSLGKEKLRLDVETKANLKTSSRKQLINKKMSSELLSNEKMSNTPRFGNSKIKSNAQVVQRIESRGESDPNELAEAQKMGSEEPREEPDEESQLVEESLHNNDPITFDLSSQKPDFKDESEEATKDCKGMSRSSRQNSPDLELERFKSDKSDDTRRSIISFKNKNSAREIDSELKPRPLLMAGKLGPKVFMKKGDSEHMRSIENTMKTLKHVDQVDVLEGRQLLSRDYSVKRDTPLSQVVDVGDQDIRVSHYEDVNVLGPENGYEGQRALDRADQDEGPQEGAFIKAMEANKFKINDDNNVFVNSKLQDTVNEDTQDKDFSINSDSSQDSEGPTEEPSQNNCLLTSDSQKKKTTAPESERSPEEEHTFANSAQKRQANREDSLRQGDIIVSSASHNRLARDSRLAEFEDSADSDHSGSSRNAESFEEQNSTLMLKQEIESKSTATDRRFGVVHGARAAAERRTAETLSADAADHDHHGNSHRLLERVQRRAREETSQDDAERKPES